jgi:hypothetical protein
VRTMIVTHPSGNKFDYDLIQRYCHKFLIGALKEKHLEDMIQFVALKFWEKECYANLEWLCLDYLRENGIGKGATKKSSILENATMVGLQGDEDSDVKENGFLLDKAVIDNHQDQDDRLTTQGILEEFFQPLGLKQETMKWVTNNYQ